MIKTLKEYQDLGCPEDYLKAGDPIDMPLARYLTNVEDIEDKIGLFTSSLSTGICGNEFTMNAVARMDYGEPYTYRGEVTPSASKNRNPRHARKIFICSPFRASTSKEQKQNLDLAKEVCRAIIINGNFPIAPHLYFPSFLQDDFETERNIGIEYGLYLLEQCDEMLVIVPGTKEDGNPYKRLTEGMKIEVNHAVERGMKPEFVSLDEIWKIAMN